MNRVIIVLISSVIFIGCTPWEKTYYKSGELKAKYQKLDSNNHGEFISYYKNGVIMQKLFYCEGLKQGECRSYDSIGNLINITHYEDNLRHGVSRFFSTTGKITTEVVFSNDSVITETKFDSIGNIIHRMRNVFPKFSEKRINSELYLLAIIKLAGPIDFSGILHGNYLYKTINSEKWRQGEFEVNMFGYGRFVIPIKEGFEYNIRVNIYTPDDITVLHANEFTYPYEGYVAPEPYAPE